MRLILSIVILMIFGTSVIFSQVDPPPAVDPPPPRESEQRKDSIQESEKPPPPRPLSRPGFEKPDLKDVVELLKEKPDWLYPADACPADIIAAEEKEVFYLQEGCADNPLRCLAQCKLEDGNACYSLALLLQQEKGLEHEPYEALFLRACKYGISSGCTNRAAAILNVEADSEKNRRCAANTFEKTCARDDSWGCTMYGLILIQGIGRSINAAEARKYLKKACELTNGQGEACETARELEMQLDEDKIETETILKMQEDE